MKNPFTLKTFAFPAGIPQFCTLNSQEMSTRFLHGLFLESRLGWLG